MSKICLLCGDTYPDTISFCAKDGSALRAAVVGDSLIGEVFCDRYVVTDLLGEGGMGAVYSARDVRLPQQVAIKVLREQGMSDPSVVARFRQEAEAASRINHDRVARVTDFGFMNDGRAFLVMEYVGGQTLKDLVAERGPLDIAETSRIVMMVAEGLDAAHRLGIVHRDLKPDNVMVLDDAGGGVRVKVLDFGIAKVLHGNEESASQTKTGFVIGTPQWMSPEQILGEPLDARSDVYALALLAYMMLTGHRAFESATTEGEMMARLTSEPRPLSELLPTIVSPSDLQPLLNRTLSRKVSERPESALAFAKEFASVAARAGNTVAATSDVRAADAPNTSFVESLTSRDTRTSPSTPAPAKTGAPLNAQPQATTPLRSDVAQTPAKRSRVPVAVGIATLAAISAIVFFFVQRSSGGDGASKATNTPTTAGALANDSLKGGAGAAPVTEPPTVVTAPVGTPPAPTPQVAPSERVPDPAPRTTAPASASGRTNTPSRDSAKIVAGSGAVPNVPSVPASNSKVATAASLELVQLMQLADANLDRKDLSAISNGIRKFESLLPELASPTDQGNAHLYIAMSHNALGDNVKACASLSRAEPLATQSKALRSNVDEWMQLLRCGN